MQPTIAINANNARERYAAIKRGEKPPPLQTRSNLTPEQTELFLDKLAKVLAELYRAEKKEELMKE